MHFKIQISAAQSQPVYRTNLHVWRLDGRQNTEEGGKKAQIFHPLHNAAGPDPPHSDHDSATYQLIKATSYLIGNSERQEKGTERFKNFTKSRSVTVGFKGPHFSRYRSQEIRKVAGWDLDRIQPESSSVLYSIYNSSDERVDIDKEIGRNRVSETSSYHKI